MRFQPRSAGHVFIALAATLSVNCATATAAIYRVDATVAATLPGVEPTVTASFSFQFDDAFLMGAPVGDQGDWPVSQFHTSLNPIGTTTFSPSNVEGYVFYNQGSLRQVLVGGVGPTILDENNIGGFSDDFYISVSLKPDGQLDDTFGSPGDFVWADGLGLIYSVPILAEASSLTITLVPEPSSGALAALAGVLVACVRRRRTGA
jgi:MYXO-CTERM domain-containing protein